MRRRVPRGSQLSLEREAHLTRSDRIKGNHRTYSAVNTTCITMSKTVHDVHAKRVIFDTSLSFDEVTARLDRELSRDKAGPKAFALLRDVTSREGLERGVQEMSGGKDFVWVVISSCLVFAE